MDTHDLLLIALCVSSLFARWFAKYAFRLVNRRVLALEESIRA
jgi:hypothetical protein